jgi:hypothetical protein
MHPSITQSRTPEGLGRWGMRGMEALTVEELARLHQKLAGWSRQRAHDPERPRRRPWVLKPKTAHPRLEERRRRVSLGGPGKETT